MNSYYIGLSVSDLQQWLGNDSLPVCVNSVFHSRINLDDQPYLDGLFNILPSFMLDDPAGVLVAEISSPASWNVDDDPKICNLDLSTVKRFIPLTADAKKVLEINWSSTICLENAVFEKEYVRFRLKRKKIAAIKAGSKFLNMFIDYGNDEFTVGDVYKNSLTRALMTAEHVTKGEINEILGDHVARFEETWIDRCFGYTRHKNIERPYDLKCFFDAGLMFKEAGLSETKLNSFRAMCNEISSAEDLTLVDICSHRDFHKFFVDFYVTEKNEDFISVVTLALFLRWKQSFYDNRAIVDTKLILDDITNLSGKVDVDIVSNALWMIGAYLGMEYVAPIYRFFHQDIYSALCFAGLREDCTPVPAWSSLGMKSFEKNEILQFKGGESDVVLHDQTAEVRKPAIREQSQLPILEGQNDDQPISSSEIELHHEEKYRFSNDFYSHKPAEPGTSSELKSSEYKDIRRSLILAGSILEYRPEKRIQVPINIKKSQSSPREVTNENLSSQFAPQMIVSTSSSNIPAYVPIDISKIGLSAADHQFEKISSERLQQAILAVVKWEGPIHIEMLWVRLTEAIGLQRAGPRIKSRVGDECQALVRQSLLNQQEDIFDVTHREILTLRDWSVLPKKQYKFKLVPMVELEKALLDELRERNSVEPDDAMRAVIAKVGFKQLTKPVRQRLEGIISFLIQKGQIQQQDERLRMP